MLIKIDSQFERIQPNFQNSILSKRLLFFFHLSKKTREISQNKTLKLRQSIVLPDRKRLLEIEKNGKMFLFIARYQSHKALLGSELYFRLLAPM